MEADYAESFTPLSTSGRWKRTKLPRKVSPYADGVPRPRAEALISTQIPGIKSHPWPL